MIGITYSSQLSAPDFRLPDNFTCPYSSNPANSESESVIVKGSALKVLLCVFAFSCLCQAQVSERFNLGGGAGVTFPTDRAGRRLNTGFNINLRGGYNFNDFLAADLDYTYQHSRLNDAT